jgi:hypothetical protein
MFKSFFNWIRPSLEGPDGKVSHRKLSVFYSFVLLTYMLITTAGGAIFPEAAWYIMAALTGGFSGLSVWQTLANKKKDENTNTDYKHTDTTL